MNASDPLYRIAWYGILRWCIFYRGKIWLADCASRDEALARIPQH